MQDEQKKRKLAPAVKFLLGAGVVGSLAACAGIVGLRYFAPDAVESVKITDKLEETEFANADVTGTDLTIGSTVPAQMNSVQFRLGAIPWMSAAGMLHANGGPFTMEGSIAEQWGVNLHIMNSDMYDPQREGLVACATQMFEEKTDYCTKGFTHTYMMGDAAAAYENTLKIMLADLPDEYQAEIIGGFGRSLGEDAFMGPPACIDEPTQCRGLRFAGVMLDGDINTAISWAAANGIAFNPDGDTWDENALNWYYTDSFNEADSAWITGFCEELVVVADGKRTGDKKRVCISGTATWTPGDVRVFRNKPGLVKLLSTWENSGQMGGAIFGIKKLNQAHKKEVIAWLASAYAGGVEVRTQRKAVAHAGQVAFESFGESTGMSAADWTFYYERREKMNPDGSEVSLGGSQAFVLSEALDFYGINKDAGEPFKVAYTYYGNMGSQLWPDILPSFPPHDEVFNPEYLIAVSELEGLERGTEVQSASKADYTEVSTSPKKAVGNMSWDIQFKTGSAKFEIGTERELRKLADQLVLAENTKVEIHGHTDDRGGEEANMKLSEDRAFAVQQWLRNHAPGRFTQGSTSVHSHGERNPLVANNSAAARAKNRRVTIVMFGL
ncbi:OmpA family protein [Candidatus Uhrbacteria bacterium]|jgi:OmpA-OmpF porin, OOP family|nr:OmpA family protein [Candidatus Uhrbacteria bacterium]